MSHNRQALILVGPPGSGKSSSIKSILEAFGGKDNVVVLSTDYYIQERAKIEGLTYGEGIEVFMTDAVKHMRYMKKRAFELGKAIIVDRTNTTRGARRSLVLEFTNNGYIVNAMEFEFDLNELLARNETRKKTKVGIPIAVILNMVTGYEPPTYDEGFSAIFKVLRRPRD